MSSVNFMELCRLCLVKDSIQIPIFEGEGDVRQIFLKIAACLPVKVKKDDRLPKNICDDCMCKVELLYQFWNTAANAEKQLLEWLGETEEKKTENVVKMEGVEQDAGSELAKSLSRVEAVLAEARDADSDGDHFADAAKPETDSDDDVPLSALEATAFVNVATSSVPSTSTTTETAPATQTQPSGKQKKCVSCALCGEAFVDGRTLSGHLAELHSTEWLLRCEACGWLFTDEISFQSHVEEHAKKESRRKTKAFACPQCDTKFSTASLLKQHGNLHTGTKPFNCNQCDRRYPLKLSLAKHKAIKHNPNYKPPVLTPSKQCEECGKQFAYAHSLRTHMKRHSGEKPFTCDHCGRKLTTRQTLYEHVNAIHMGIKPFSCDMCQKAFVTEKILRLHKKIHESSKPHVCRFCGKSFTQSTAMLFHMRYHLGQKPFVCPHCHKGFVSVSLMKRHVRLSHEGSKDEFQCDECGVRCTTRQALRLHIHEHTVHFYTCESCDRTFDSRSKYSRHVRGHSKTTLACGDCDKVLSSRSSLKRHSKVHAVESQAPSVAYIVSYHPLNSSIINN